MASAGTTPPARKHGLCYLNNIAIAALAARASGSQRVAVFDFDVHHGNGTQDILLNQPGVAFFSVHNIRLPETGAENAGHNCFNYPFRPPSRATVIGPPCAAP